VQESVRLASPLKITRERVEYMARGESIKKKALISAELGELYRMRDLAVKTGRTRGQQYVGFGETVEQFSGEDEYPRLEEGVGLQRVLPNGGGSDQNALSSKRAPTKRGSSSGKAALRGISWEEWSIGAWSNWGPVRAELTGNIKVSCSGWKPLRYKGG